MSLELPSWADEFYPHQLDALQAILAEYNAGRSIVVMDAPTGAGKTLIAELVRQSFNCRAVYICSSISLQEQFVKDFPHAALLKGRANYATADSPDDFPRLNAGDCIKEKSDLPACSRCDPSYFAEDTLHCRWCHPVPACPYEDAKRTAIRSDLVCSNTAYFLHEANYVGNLPLARQLIIVDEADLLEDALLSFVEVHIPQRRAVELGIEAPAKKTVESAWIEWAIYAEAHLKEVKARGTFSSSSIGSIRQRKSLEHLIRNVGRLNDPTHGISAGGWVYTGYDKGDISFKPITVDHVAKEYLWKHSPRWLLMSATTISFPVMMASLGL
jgi:Rad3-related DNA helicase